MRLVRYDAACRALAEAKSVDEVKDFRDKAEAMRAYARQAKNRDLEVDAAEIRIRAERRLGEIIAQHRDADLLNAGTLLRGVEKTPRDERPTLSEMGIDKNLAKRVREFAAVPEHRFENMLADWRDRVRRENERVTVDLLREGRRAQARADYESRKVAGGTVGDLESLADGAFAVIYADPPWEFRVYNGADGGRTADRHYDTKPLEVIKGLPVDRLAADDCALFLWAVMPELPGALGVISAWGFEFKTVAFTWVKQNRGGEGLFTGMGHWTRANAEICLLATRGSPLRLAADVQQIIMSPVREHSRKPDEARSRIERLLAGPYLELYGRQHAPGWTVWGNEMPGAL